MKRSALLIGTNKEGKILLHHKTADAPTNANLWVLVGGGVEQGEEPSDAIVREIREEFAMTIKPEFFKTYIHNETWGTVERHVFFALIIESPENLRSAQEEGDDLRFFSLNEMAGLPMNKNHFEIIGEFLRSPFYRKQ